MFTLKNTDEGLRISATIMPRGGATREIPARITIYEGAYYMCHSDPTLGGSQNLRQMYGYAFAVNVPQDLRRVHEYISNVIAVTKTNGNGIYFKQTDSGLKFRKVYKKDGEMIFVGPVVKDIEDCNNPAAVITIIDIKYIESTGWTPYEKEKSAEERLRDQPVKA